MKKTPDFDAAAEFMATHARVLDRRVFQRLFQGGAPDPVRDAVAAYRNDDGGFGHALEPDLRTAASQPAAVEMALRIMDAADAWDEHLVRDAIDWLTSIAPSEGGATFVLPTLSQGPHAPWWAPAEGNPVSLIQTGQIAGVLYARGFNHPWRDGATEVMWRGIDQLTEPNAYEMFGVLHSSSTSPTAPAPRTRCSESAGRFAPSPRSTRTPRARPTPPLLRPAPRLDRPQPVRRRHDRGPPEPPGRRSARGRRLDVQLARLVASRRVRLARLPHSRRAPRAPRERPRVSGGVRGWRRGTRRVRLVIRTSRRRGDP